jgi:DNA-binding XRE family transcriptional regulator
MICGESRRLPFVLNTAVFIYFVDLHRRDTLMRTHEVTKSMKPTSDGLKILHRRYYAEKPVRLKGLEEARANEEIARKILELRTAAGFTQSELARLIGTTTSVICRLEDADYEGHSLPVLRKIASALNQRVEIRFVPIRRTA